MKAEKPTESPEGVDCVTRLMQRLREEGFSSDLAEEEWHGIDEAIFRRDEKISFARGETVFIFTRIPELNDRILRQTSESVVNLYRAKSPLQKALSVLQSITVYHCLVPGNDQPHNELLNEYITRSGGATFIPVVMVPAINQVLYPNLEQRVGTIRPRIEYLQYLLNERRDPVDMHRPTVQAFYVSLGVLAVVLLAVVFSMFA
ncbi:MAG TPA: hypothetical protein VNA04_04840 [Thermoanaerobaculia bacterium]|nr:hypothetical protein [Thermoanaerobaculia bacterium]